MTTININELIRIAEIESADLFKQIEEIALYNQKKVLDSFRKHKVSPMHFSPSTGYGYDDIGRDTLSKVFSSIFMTESSIVSPMITSGTQAISIALFGLLRPYNSLLCITGNPYDTLEKVIKGNNIGSLKDYLINYNQIELDSTGKIQIDLIDKCLSERFIDIILITRSEGYSWREALSINEIEKAIIHIKTKSPNTIIMVDNCYGEFVDKLEPSEVGADIIVGSLIKNPGGGIAPTGGYISGREVLIKKIGSRLTCPGLGLEVGSYFSSYIPYFEGLFLAPSHVSNALKGSVISAKCFKHLGYEVNPEPDILPKDLIRAIKFSTKDLLIKFIQSIQYSSPIDSHVTPYPWDMPGYKEQVIMAAGTFIQGSSIELSSDAPIKEPFIAYLQGGLTYEHYKIALYESIKNLLS
ncbi:MAG: methionine gamma-lyase family protein [Clostridia bacterium]